MNIILCDFLLQVLHDELSSTRLWVSMHVSDHSGFHYRQHLLKALARELSQVGESELHPTQQPNGESTAGASDDNHQNDILPQLFHKEMELCTDLIESYPGHETLWCHRWEWSGRVFEASYRSPGLAVPMVVVQSVNIRLCFHRSQCEYSDFVCQKSVLGPQLVWPDVFMA